MTELDNPHEITEFPVGNNSKFWFRFDSSATGYFDEFEYFHPTPHVDIRLSRFKELEETKCGVWIAKYEYMQTYLDRKVPREEKRFTLRKSKKKYAYPTIEEAWASFGLRKKRQCSILKSQLELAESSRKASTIPLEEALKLYNIDTSYINNDFEIANP